LPEKSSKQVSVAQQNKAVCLTLSFEGNNFVFTSKYGKMLISHQQATSKMLFSLKKIKCLFHENT